MASLLTIGHSNHPWSKFLGLLKDAEVSALVDVRSYPRSRFPQFARSALETRLAAAGIAYRYMGNDLGGRLGDQATYATMSETAGFKRGLRAVEQLARQARVALMCSEHEPLECHRFLLIARELTAHGVKVAHIVRSGQIESHENTEGRLLALRAISEEERLATAYRDQELALRRKQR